jgi:hypothetical protein
MKEIETLVEKLLSEGIWPFEYGSTQIWYFKPNEARNMMMGYDFCKKEGCLPDPHDLKKTHIFMGHANETNPEKIFHALQGEVWSPNGEARSFIQKTGSSHTSMSTGDVVVIGGSAYMVDRMGFKKL